MGVENLFKEMTFTCDLKDENGTEARNRLLRGETRDVVKVKQ